jgi:hypothetical protein
MLRPTRRRAWTCDSLWIRVEVVDERTLVIAQDAAPPHSTTRRSVRSLAVTQFTREVWPASPIFRVASGRLRPLWNVLNRPGPHGGLSSRYAGF